MSQLIMNTGELVDSPIHCRICGQPIPHDRISAEEQEKADGPAGNKRSDQLFTAVMEGLELEIARLNHRSAANNRN